ncbi:MAG: hypothetical protein ACK4PG_09405 [Acetobacteraceae bacterium]
MRGISAASPIARTATTLSRRGAAILVVMLASCAPATPSLTAAAWCDGFEQERLGLTGRLEGKNLTRLRAAEGVVAPAVGRTRAVSGISLLGGYQEALQAQGPDLTGAAMYLAAASGRPVTEQLVREVNALLCVATTPAQVRTIATEAQAAWQDMQARARS